MRAPTVLVPYPGPTGLDGEQDIAIYLRPESNGVRVESTILRVIRSSPTLRDRVRMVYLANIPGSFISGRGVVAEHYATRVHFAQEGKAAFTAGMRSMFERAFGVAFAGAQVIGAFDALQRLAIQAEELFHVRVPPEHFAVILGQTVKHFRDHYIVNYDIPAVLLKHHGHTDVFSMLLRSSAEYPEFVALVRDIEGALREEQIVTEDAPVGRIFHYSRGPFDQILDGLGYLYQPDASPVPLHELSFARFLLEHGVAEARILELVRHPLLLVSGPESTREVELYEYTRALSYPAALARLRTVVGVLPVPPGGGSESQTPR